MEREQIIRMAREAGLVRAGDGWTEPHRWGLAEIEAFANLVAAAERSACAAMAEAFHRHQYDFTGNLELHEAIRARGEK
jgi:hypothetical protein